MLEIKKGFTCNRKRDKLIFREGIDGWNQMDGPDGTNS